MRSVGSSVDVQNVREKGWWRHAGNIFFSLYAKIHTAAILQDSHLWGLLPVKECIRTCPPPVLFGCPFALLKHSDERIHSCDLAIYPAGVK